MWLQLIHLTPAHASRQADGAASALGPPPVNGAGSSTSADSEDEGDDSENEATPEAEDNNNDDDDEEEEEEEDDVWRPETVTPAGWHIRSKTRNTGARTGMARSLAPALDLVRAWRLEPRP